MNYLLIVLGLALIGTGTIRETNKRTPHLIFSAVGEYINDEWVSFKGEPIKLEAGKQYTMQYLPDNAGNFTVMQINRIDKATQMGEFKKSELTQGSRE